MRIGFLTCDEMNGAIAARLARDASCALDIFRPGEQWHAGQDDAFLCDLDSLEPPDRRAILDNLLTRPLPCPVALHGYDVESEPALAARGVIVVRRLDASLFRRLLAARDRDAALGLLVESPCHPAAQDGRLRPAVR